MQCLMPALTVTRDANVHTVVKSDSGKFYPIYKEQSLLVPAIEDRFFKLVSAGQKYGYDTDAIMEKPNPLGSTVFEAATLFSDKICEYILNRNIRVNNILSNFVYPVFPLTCEVTWEKMLKKGINPKVITGRVSLTKEPFFCNIRNDSNP